MTKDAWHVAVLPSPSPECSQEKLGVAVRQRPLALRHWAKTCDSGINRQKATSRCPGGARFLCHCARGVAGVSRHVAAFRQQNAGAGECRETSQVSTAAQPLPWRRRSSGLFLARKDAVRTSHRTCFFSTGASEAGPYRDPK